MGWSVTLAGQDITAHVDETSIDVTDVLGQGAGTGSITAGRAAECDLLTDLGPITAAIGAGQSTQDYASQVLTDGATIFYKMQESAGTTLVDSGPSGTNATLQGTYALQQRNIAVGETGSKSVFFDGNTGTALTALPISHSTAMFSFELGFTMPDATNTGFNGLLCTDNVGGTNKGWDVGFKNDDASYFFFDIGNGTSNTSAASGVAASSPGTLMHVIGTYDGTTARLYLNGSLIASVALSGFQLGTKQFSIASREAGGFGFARVDVAYVAIYNTALSAPQVASHYSKWSSAFQPKLVRQGEIIITDAFGNRIFGGYANDFIDQTNRTKVYTQIKAHDYWQSLDRIIINEVYAGQTDIFIIRDLVTKYAPWIDLSFLPTTSSYQFGVRNFVHFTLQKALQNVVDATGYAIWIDYYKKLHYVLPTNATTAPFSLSSNPDRSTTFPFMVIPGQWERDDTAAINRVYFYGGKNLSPDYVQDMSSQANGVATTFVLAYYPHKAKDGFFHLTINGTTYTSQAGHGLGIVGGNGADNTLIHDGGNAHALLNIDAHAVEFNTAPAGGSTVSMTYRHEVPLVVVITDQNSFQFYGQYYDGVISDASVFDGPTAVQRCKVILLEQSLGLEHLQVKCWKAGLQAGQLISVHEQVRGINTVYMIQKVETKPVNTSTGAAGNFEYTVDLGAWRWDLVDIVMQSARAATPSDDASDTSTAPLAVSQLLESLTVVESYTATPHTPGTYTYDTTAKYGLATYA